MSWPYNTKRVQTFSTWFDILGAKPCIKICPDQITIHKNSTELWLCSHGNGPIFDPAEKFDLTVPSQGNVQYFRSVLTELWTLNVEILVRLSWFRVNASPKSTNFSSTGWKFNRCRVNLGSVSSLGCLDVPAVLPTRLGRGVPEPKGEGRLSLVLT